MVSIVSIVTTRRYFMPGDHDARTCALQSWVEAVQNGRFDVLDCRFDVLDCRFDVLDCRFDVLECRFDVLACASWKSNSCLRQ
jgi:Holliday junction resolvase-like predicted endonuclease